MWKHREGRGRLRRQCDACAFHAGYLITNAPLEYVVLNGFQLQKYLHEIPSMLPYNYIACVVYGSHIRYVNVL
jgi:hypothetical protein